MKRQIRAAEIILLIGLSFIFLFMLVHDWIPLGTLNDVEAVFEARSVQEVIVVTLIGAVQFLLLLSLVLWFMGRKYPIWLKLWLIIHQGFIFAGVLLDWWIPYIFGYGAEERIERYNAMFGNTHAFLPISNGIVPNTLHMLFHFTLLVCLLVTFYISFTRSVHNHHHERQSM